VSDTLVGHRLRSSLASSRRWLEAVKELELPLMVVARSEPIALDDCTDLEAFDIQAWASGMAKEMPPRLAGYLDALRAAYP
jgi:hypothetical protein